MDDRTFCAPDSPIRPRGKYGDDIRGEAGEGTMERHKIQQASERGAAESSEPASELSPILAYAAVWRKLMAANRELSRLLDHARMLGVDLGDVPEHAEASRIGPSIYDGRPN